MKPPPSLIAFVWFFCAILLASGQALADSTALSYASPIHYRPATGALADTIPLFFQNQYHVFYLHAGVEGTPWEHIVSSDLVHWTELPTALTRDSSDPNGPDGGNMFTGSVIAYQGAYHIFYTGHNPNNPNGVEFICHATSSDGVTWTKYPGHAFGADGVHYRTQTDFRDPYVFWNEAANCFWMLLCAREAAAGKPVQGVARSLDLVTWEQIDPLVFDPPLESGASECPDLFKCGSTWYLLHSPSAGTTDVRWARDLSGPWLRPTPYSIDTSILYAAKRMNDGRRHILTGWLRDLTGDADNGGGMWGGTQCLPREAYEGPSGQLYFKPADEVVAVFSNVYCETQMTVGPDTPVAVDAPDNYLLDCRVRLDAQSEFTVAFRQQADETAYRLTVRPGASEVEIAGPGFSSKRTCTVDASRLVKIQAFVQGSIIECFVNDQYAFSRRAYYLTQGDVGLSVAGGSAEVVSLQIRTPSGVVINPSLSGLPGVMTVHADLTLAASAVLYYDYTSQTADTVRVEGTLNIQGHNTVNLTAVNGASPPRRITLFTFDALTGGEHLSGWGVQGEGLGSYAVKLLQDEDSVYLQFTRDGTVFFVR